MTWLTPWLGGAAAAIAVPTLLILYFLKLRRRDVEVSTTLLWKKAVQDLQANAPFQRLRRNLLLLLQLIILVLAVVALAQPERRTAAQSGSQLVVLIDRSASMRTMDAADDDGNPISRLERAKLEAKAAMDALPRGTVLMDEDRGEAMVIAFDASGAVVHPFTSDVATLKRAIDGIKPSDGPSQINEAIVLATAHAKPVIVENIGLMPGAPIHLWSDGDITDLDTVDLLKEQEFVYHAVGTDGTPNLAISAVRAERAFDDPGRLSVFVGVQSTDPEARSVDVTFAIDGTVRLVQPVRLPGATAEGPAVRGTQFRLDRPEGAVVTVSLATDDALAVDNTAQLVIPPAKRLTVALVTDGNIFVEDALRSLPPIARLDVMTPAAFEGVANDGRTNEYDVVVLDRWVPPAGAFEHGLPPGRYLVIGAIPAMRGLVGSVPDDADPGAIIDWDRQHPAFRFASLYNVYTLKPFALELGDEARVLATTTVGPAIVELTQGPVQAIVVGFDILESNWPLDLTNWMLFVGPAVRHLGDAASSVATEILRPGTTIATTLPPGARDVSLQTPAGERIDLTPAEGGRVAYGPVRTAGLYRIVWTGDPGPQDAVDGSRVSRLIPVNVSNPKESDLRVLEAIELPYGEVSAKGRGDASLVNQQIWPWLILGAIAVVMLEWFIYNRKVYV